MVRARRRIGATGAIAALFALAGVAYAASTNFAATTSFGGNQQTVSSPCTRTDVTITPTYSASDGAYVVTSVLLDLSCPAGDYRVSVALGTGGATYVEKTSSFSASGGITTVVATLPSRVKVSDLVNVAVLVTPS